MAQSGNGNVLRIILGVLVTVFIFFTTLSFNAASKASDIAFTNKENIAVLTAQYNQIIKDLDEIKSLLRNK